MDKFHHMFYHDQPNGYTEKRRFYKRDSTFPQRFTVKRNCRTERSCSTDFLNVECRILERKSREYQPARTSKMRGNWLIVSHLQIKKIFEASDEKGVEEARRRAKFYDYIEVMPKAVYAPLIEQGVEK